MECRTLTGNEELTTLITPGEFAMTRPVRQRIRSGPSSECGITLVEILIALAIIGVGLVGVAAVVPISSYGLQEGNQVSTATFLVEQRIEQLKAAAWTASPGVDCLGTSGTSSSSWSFSGGTAPAPGGTCNPTSFADETPTGSTTATPPTKLSDPYGGYTRQVRIRPCDAGGAGCGIVDPALRLATVRVSYTPLQAVGGVATTSSKFVELTMLLAQR
jgi:prepilin-type N-terminal cleavage/methylation domain-containing protein